MNEWALGWLRAMKPPTPPPAPPVRTPRIETPPHLRHTVPPTAYTTSSDLPPRESLDALQRYAWRCVGLCIGGTCERCDITQLQTREAELTAQIRALEEGR